MPVIKFELNSNQRYSERERIRAQLMEWLYDNGMPKHTIYSNISDITIEFADEAQCKKFRSSWTGTKWS